MPTISNGQAMLASRALQALMHVKRPVQGAMRMRALARALATQLEDVEAERRKLVEVYAAKDERGAPIVRDNQLTFPEGAAQAAFTKEFGDLLACTWECPLALAPDDFGGLDVEPELLLMLGDLLEDPPAPAATAA